MVWSCFAKNGLGPLIVIEGTVNATKYKMILEENLVPLMADWYPSGNGVFQQDNAPCHKAQLIKNFLDECDFSVLDWPIENL